jgi:hypothetical protein
MTHILNCKNMDQNANGESRQHVFKSHHHSKEQIHKNSTRSFESKKVSECLAENPSTSMHFATCVQRSCAVCGILEHRFVISTVN